MPCYKGRRNFNRPKLRISVQGGYKPYVVSAKIKGKKEKALANFKYKNDAEIYVRQKRRTGLVE